MKIYDFVGAPNPRKLRIYLSEKGISVEHAQVQIDPSRANVARWWEAFAQRPSAQA